MGFIYSDWVGLFLDSWSCSGLIAQKQTAKQLTTWMLRSHLYKNNTLDFRKAQFKKINDGEIKKNSKVSLMQTIV